MVLQHIMMLDAASPTANDSFSLPCFRPERGELQDMRPAKLNTRPRRTGGVPKVVVGGLAPLRLLRNRLKHSNRMLIGDS